MSVIPTKLYDLPLEMLDIILEKSYLHWIFGLSTKQRDEEVIRSLASVDVCFYQRITRKRSKKAIWRHLKGRYENRKKGHLIIRNSRSYFLKFIQPNDKLFAALLSLNCLTQEQSQLIQRKHLNRDKNAELFCVTRFFDGEKLSNFVKCLRQINQKTAAKIIENGGGVIKLEVRTLGEKYSPSVETDLLYEAIEDLRNRAKPWSHRTEELISQLKEAGIEILDAQLDGQTVVVWIWCRSQAALEYMQRLHESNQLRDVIFENIQPSTPMMITIDRNQFKKTVVVCAISTNFSQRIKLLGNEKMFGMAKLRNEIYVICRSYSDAPDVIRVFDDQNPCLLQMEIEIKDIKDPWDIRSSEKENCLYVSDSEGQCVFKITRETDDKYNIMKWLEIDFHPDTLSVSSDGQLLLVDSWRAKLMMYESDAKLIRSIQLPKGIEQSLHTVKTSIGNFIVSHRWMVEEDNNEQEAEKQEENEEQMKKEDNEDGKEEMQYEEERMKEEGVSGSSRRRSVIKWVVSELTSDGQMVVRRFIPSDKTQELKNPSYLSLDLDDQVFVADDENNRVILLDSDLKWIRTLIPDEGDREAKMQKLSKLWNDEENKQLFVGFSGERSFVNVYTFHRS